MYAIYRPMNPMIIFFKKNDYNENKGVQAWFGTFFGVEDASNLLG